MYGLHEDPQVSFQHLPTTLNPKFFPSSSLTRAISWSCEMEEAGLMPTLKTSNSPLVMPPRVPPGATYPWFGLRIHWRGGPYVISHIEATHPKKKHWQLQKCPEKSETRVEDAIDYARQNVSTSSRKLYLAGRSQHPADLRDSSCTSGARCYLSTSRLSHPHPLEKTSVSQFHHQEASMMPVWVPLQQAEMELLKKMCDYHVFKFLIPGRQRAYITQIYHHGHRYLLDAQPITGPCPIFPVPAFAEEVVVLRATGAAGLEAIPNPRRHGDIPRWHFPVIFHERRT